ILGAHPELAAVIAYYRAVRVDRSAGRVHNSLDRPSLAAHPGWTGADLLGRRGAVAAGGPSPLQQELAALDPAVAIVMFGTNDVDQTGLDAFSQDLDAVVTTILDAGIIPVLSTIPDRRDTPQAAARSGPFNAAIRELAAREHVPLIDYGRAMQDLPHHGLAADQVHPSNYPSPCPACASVTFTPPGLRYGWNQRNFLTLEMLAHLKAVVIDDGPPDP
ncbi:MAG TPA: SGNH/GDSL hydrolase family protein, partial [Chloroflexia bacterium]|nr:SGNH/GDSL hydrolase family protein [Chloroflexia bacterium]